MQLEEGGEDRRQQEEKEEEQRGEGKGRMGWGREKRRRKRGGGRRRRSRTGRLMAQGQNGIWRRYERQYLKGRLTVLGSSQATQSE